MAQRATVAGIAIAGVIVQKTGEEPGGQTGKPEPAGEPEDASGAAIV